MLLSRLEVGRGLRTALGAVFVHMTDRSVFQTLETSQVCRHNVTAAEGLSLI